MSTIELDLSIANISSARDVPSPQVVGQNGLLAVTKLDGRIGQSTKPPDIKQLIPPPPHFSIERNIQEW
ncbi:hypothetical protein A2160_01080 [Candidatus Beckwithbacteria bacterium RBG_13_42_9]|uniref:Uncharacterized protein n=1 Tax=Candidatus Beckwithbacteria bacterium RBG_13_42_9 TaxID=1797457 RepID=A0A1F5E3T2_9BACT|nr:MAG: hypothetical protein A2160_01080 [Candidatus Beckwithbacteria bacterium RBG_13_42_9]